MNSATHAVQAVPHVGRFAPSTTGAPHPGTLAAALWAWCDVRACSKEPAGRFVLRMEDLDPQRCKPAFADEMLQALTWLGLDWDVVECQSQQEERYSAAVDYLADQGWVYACDCSRAAIKRAGCRRRMAVGCTLGRAVKK